MHHLQLLSSSFNIQNPRLCPNHSLSSLHSSTPISLASQSLPLLSTSRHFRKKRSLQCRQSDYFQQQSFTPRQPPNDSSFGGALQPRVFVGHSIYKGKAALTVEPRAPEFTPLDSGAFKVSKEGFVLLQFAPAAGVRQYDWSRKQVFSLSVTEIGNLISLGAKDSCEFFHDPFKGRSEEGKVRKVLKVEPLPDGSGHFFNLSIISYGSCCVFRLPSDQLWMGFFPPENSVQNKLLNMDESIYIPITRAEYAVLTSAFNYIVPYLLGWHTFTNSIKPEDAARTNSANPRSGDFEWSR